MGKRPPYHYDTERVTAICARCRGSFSYVRKTKDRMYCDPCKDLEKKDNAKVSNRKCYLNLVKPRREALKGKKP